MQTNELWYWNGPGWYAAILAGDDTPHVYMVAPPSSTLLQAIAAAQRRGFMSVAEYSAMPDNAVNAFGLMADDDDTDRLLSEMSDAYGRGY